jgi:hypothetical protein
MTAVAENLTLLEMVSVRVDLSTHTGVDIVDKVQSKM